MKRLVACILLTLAAPSVSNGAEAVCEGHAPETAYCTRSFIVEGDSGVGMSIWLTGGVLQGFQGALRAEAKSPTGSADATCVALGPGPGLHYCNLGFSTGFEAGQRVDLTVIVAGEGSWQVRVTG